MRSHLQTTVWTDRFLREIHDVRRRGERGRFVKVGDSDRQRFGRAPVYVILSTERKRVVGETLVVERVVLQ